MNAINKFYCKHIILILTTISSLLWYNSISFATSMLYFWLCQTLYFIFMSCYFYCSDIYLVFGKNKVCISEAYSNKVNDRLLNSVKNAELVIEQKFFMYI